MTEGGLDAERLRALVEHFERTFARHGPTARGVDWRSESAQAERIEILVAELLRSPRASVCDLGCGYGPLLDALRAAGHEGRYSGVDLSGELIGSARTRHAHDREASFRFGSAPGPADFVVASGLFSLRLGVGERAWRAHLDSTLRQMVACASVAVLANFLLSPPLPSFRPDLHYEDPERVSAVLRAAGASDVRIVTKPGLLDFTAVAYA